VPGLQRLEFLLHPRQRIVEKKHINDFTLSGVNFPDL
jgi:hypothetical protein